MGVVLRTGQSGESVMDGRRRTVLDRLANATEALLIHRPVSEVSLNEIIDLSKVAKATVYKLFNDKNHLLQFVAERLLSVCREYQLRDFDEAPQEDWRKIYSGLCDGAAAFYHDRPAAMRLWLANDSPASIRAVDQASDDAFLNGIRSRLSETKWHARLPDPVLEVDVLTASLRIYDAVLALGFSTAGHNVPQRYFEEAKRASVAYLETYLEPAARTRAHRQHRATRLGHGAI
jgi:AcrR family transcriptional regulator